MFDRKGIYERFASCYSAKTPVELAKILGVKHPTVFQWKSGLRLVPWNRMKTVVNEQGICWDWLIEGTYPKSCPNHAKKANKLFDRHGINQRFLSLFPCMTQEELAKILNVKQATVSYWHTELIQVSWDKLMFAVSNKMATWEWLIEGC